VPEYPLFEEKEGYPDFFFFFTLVLLELLDRFARELELLDFFTPVEELPPLL
jgi:hypothetical protein